MKYLQKLAVTFLTVTCMACSNTEVLTSDQHRSHRNAIPITSMLHTHEATSCLKEHSHIHRYKNPAHIHQSYVPCN